MVDFDLGFFAVEREERMPDVTDILPGSIRLRDGGFKPGSREVDQVVQGYLQLLGDPTALAAKLSRPKARARQQWFIEQRDIVIRLLLLKWLGEYTEPPDGARRQWLSWRDAAPPNALQEVGIDVVATFPSAIDLYGKARVTDSNLGVAKLKKNLVRVRDVMRSLNETFLPCLILVTSVPELADRRLGGSARLNDGLTLDLELLSTSPPGTNLSIVLALEDLWSYAERIGIELPEIVKSHPT